MQINRLFEIVYILLDKKTITAKALAERFAVSKTENDELSVKIIPTGKYAKFSVHGHMEKAVAKAWGKSGKWTWIEALPEILRNTLRVIGRMQTLIFTSH